MIKLLYTTISLALVSTLLSSCGTSLPTRMYTLHPAQLEPPSTSGPSITLTSISLPGYLDGDPIAVRLSDHEVKLHDTQIWASPLDKEILKCLEENLRQSLGTLEVDDNRHMETHSNFLIDLEILRFEKNQTGNVVLDLIWKIKSPVTRRQLLIKQQRFKVPAGGDDFESIAAAHSQALASFAKVLTTDLLDLQQSTN